MKSAFGVDHNVVSKSWSKNVRQDFDDATSNVWQPSPGVKYAYSGKRGERARTVGRAVKEQYKGRTIKDQTKTAVRHAPIMAGTIAAGTGIGAVAGALKGKARGGAMLGAIGGSAAATGYGNLMASAPQKRALRRAIQSSHEAGDVVRVKPTQKLTISGKVKNQK